MKHLTLTLVGFWFVLSSHSMAQTPTPAYLALCFACHGPDGKGIGAGTPTPMAPPFVGSKFVNDGDGEIMASIVFTGIAKEGEVGRKTRQGHPATRQQVTTAF